MKQPPLIIEEVARIGVVLPARLVDEIDALAQKEMLSRSTWCRRLILNALQNEKAVA